MRVIIRYDNETEMEIEATREDLESGAFMAGPTECPEPKEVIDPLASLILDIARSILLSLGLSDGSVVKVSNEKIKDAIDASTIPESIKEVTP